MSAPLGPLGPGRSPRVRGSRGERSRPANIAGSITACAGKPPAVTSSPALARVDHRVCGEAHRQNDAIGDTQGRSPRVRGSLPRRANSSLASRSITACAGKPRGSDQGRWRWGVDHRVCGEAPAGTTQNRACEGRSPRVRGSRHLGLVLRRWQGSITACAGKPSAGLCFSRTRRVDHRVCGEASATLCLETPLSEIKLSKNYLPAIRLTRLNSARASRSAR